VFFLNLEFYLMLKLLARPEYYGGKIWAWALLATFPALAILGHIMYGLFIVPIAYTAFELPKGRETGRKFFSASALMVGAGVLMLVIYLAAYWAGPGGTAWSAPGAQRFVKWVLGGALTQTSYGYRESYWDLHLSSVGFWLKGMEQTFFAGIYQGPQAWDWTAAALKIYGGLAIAGALGSFGYSFIRTKGRSVSQNLLLAWLLPGAVFTIFWEPLNFEHKMYFLPALWMMVFIGWPLPPKKSLKIASTLALACLALGLFGGNFFNEVYPDSKESVNYDLKIAEAIKAATPEKSVVIISGTQEGWNIGKIYLPYFSDRRTIVLDWVLSERIGGRSFPQNLDDRIASEISGGNDVYVLSEVWSRPVLEILFSHHRIDMEALKNYWSRFKLKPVAKFRTFDLYQVQPP
jgi:hypothetical protein